MRWRAAVKTASACRRDIPCAEVPTLTSSIGVRGGAAAPTTGGDGVLAGAALRARWKGQTRPRRQENSEKGEPDHRPCCLARSCRRASGTPTSVVVKKVLGRSSLLNDSE